MYLVKVSTYGEGVKILHVVCTRAQRRCLLFIDIDIGRILSNEDVVLNRRFLKYQRDTLTLSSAIIVG